MIGEAAMETITLFHGSNQIVELPELSQGNLHNDYGQGFYCTADIELAREWACKDDRGGFVNTYRLNTEDLRVFELNNSSIIEWLAILLNNRKIRYSSPIEKMTAEYLMEHYMPDVTGYDVITGYRADDSYFSFARAFLSNTITIQQLAGAMKLGELGMQVFIKSKAAFEHLSFVEAEMVSGDVYFLKRIDRDVSAREAFDRMLEEGVTEGIFARDILREEPDIHELCL